MKGSIRDLSCALAISGLALTALVGCDGSSSQQSSVGASTSSGSVAVSSASGSSGATSASGSARASGSRATGTARSRSRGVAASATRSQAEIPVASADPCKITSASSVTRAFGGTVITAAAGTSGTGSSTCHYVLAHTQTGTGLVLDLSLTRNVSRPVFDEVKNQPGNQSVSGVGQDAYYRSASKALQIYVRGSVAAMQATLTKPANSAQRTVLRRHQILLGKIIASQS